MLEEYWWIENGIPKHESKSGCVRASVRAKFKSFSKMRACVWKWFRSRAGDRTLSPACKLTLWAICERFRVETFSSHDAYSYYAKMIGMNRRSVGRAVSALAEKGLIRVALEEERKLVEKAIAGKRKHILLVGLGYSLRKVV